MTHFVGLVVAETEAEIAALLQPFHEYESTGVEDQYVVDLDITAEAREEFAKNTTDCLRDESGNLQSFFTPEGNWDKRFSQEKVNAEPWQRGDREPFVPPGYTRVDVPTSEIESFGKWASDYYGAQAFGEGDDTKIIQHTNPNKKWDWWAVGGRWGDMVPGHNCMAEDVSKHFTEYKPSVLIDAEGWHSAKDWGWFGSSAPTDTPDVVTAKLAQHAGKRVWVVDFHI